MSWFSQKGSRRPRSACSDEGGLAAFGPPPWPAVLPAQRQKPRREDLGVSAGGHGRPRVSSLEARRNAPRRDQHDRGREPGMPEPEAVDAADAARDSDPLLTTTFTPGTTRWPAP